MPIHEWSSAKRTARHWRIWQGEVPESSSNNVNRQLITAPSIRYRRDELQSDRADLAFAMNWNYCLPCFSHLQGIVGCEQGAKQQFVENGENLNRTQHQNEHQKDQVEGHDAVNLFWHEFHPDWQWGPPGMEKCESPRETDEWCGGDLSTWSWSDPCGLSRITMRARASMLNEHKQKVYQFWTPVSSALVWSRQPSQIQI